MGGPGSGGHNKKPIGMKLGCVSKATRAERERAEQLASQVPMGVPQPAFDPKWHRMAQAWWRALGASDIARIAQPADWMLAWVAADVLDRMYRYGFTAGLLKEWHSIVSTLHAPRLDILDALNAEPDDIDEDEAEADAAVADIRNKFRVVDGNG